jgi:hypothetical protein
MSIQIYKPNKNNTGFAFSFYMTNNHKDESASLFINAIAQHTWNDQKKIGSFSGNKDNPDKNISIKFNQFECGSIISCIENRYEWNTYHAYEDNKTQIKLSPWDKVISNTKINQKTKEPYEEKITIPAFGIVITRNGNQVFKIPLEPGEVECIKALCQAIILYSCKPISYNKNNKTEVSQETDYDF